jgi:addiction module HigA family antidote
MARATIHPGEHLSEQLGELRMSASELARQIKVPTNRVTQILKGERAITGDTALRLGHFFGTSAEFWLNLQKTYELRIAEQQTGTAIKALPRLTDRRAKPVLSHSSAS